jgi:hypothetical protein
MSTGRQQTDSDSVELTAGLLPQDQASDGDLRIAISDEPPLHALGEKYLEIVTKKNNKQVSPAVKKAQAALAILGSPCGFLYVDPAEICARVVGGCDDKWMSGLPQTGRQYIYFSAGFVGFVSTNCTFAYYALTKHMELRASYDSPLKKNLATGAVGVLVLMQTGQMYLSAVGMNEAPINVLLTMIGITPGAFYGGTGIVIDAPRITANMWDRSQRLYYAWRQKSLTQEKRNTLIRKTFYDFQRKQFNDFIAANWKSVVKNVHSLTVVGNEDPLTFLLSQNALPQAESTFAGVSRNIMKWGVGGVITSLFTAGFLNNTYDALKSYFDATWARVLVGTALSSAMIYGNISLTGKAIMTGHDVLQSKLKGEPIDSLTFQLRPWKTAGIIAASAAFATFSYAAADLTWQNMCYPPAEEGQPPVVKGEWNDGWKSVGRGVARTGIDVYHAMGPADVGMQILFRRILFHGTPKEKFLAYVQLVVEYLTATMTQQEFVAEVENKFTPELRSLLHVQSWQEVLSGMQGKDVAVIRSEIKKMGLEKFTDNILAEVRVSHPKVEMTDSRTSPVSPSSSAAHWQSSNYMLRSPSQGAISASAASMVEEHKSASTQSRTMSHT